MRSLRRRLLGVLAQPPSGEEGDGLSVEFKIGSAARFLGAAITYDAWLVQQLPSGASETHYMRTTGRQGEKVCSIGSTGRTHLSTTPGETVEFEPADFTGSIDGQPVAAILRDARTAIRIRASRAW